MNGVGRVMPYCLAALALVSAAPCESVADEGTRHISARDLVTLVDLDGLAVSPDGRWAAFQTRVGDPRANTYAQAWHVVSTAGGGGHRLADAGDPILSGGLGRLVGAIVAPPPAWSLDSQWIVYLKKANGRTQVWRARVDGRRTEQLTHGTADARGLVLSSDGRQLLFQAEPSEAEIDATLAEEGRSGFLYDNRFAPVYRSTPVLPADVQLDSSGRAFSSAAREAQRRTFVYDFVTRRSRAATEAEAVEYAARIAAPQPNGREHYRENATTSFAGALAWTEARDPERQGGMAPLTVVAAPAGHGEPVVCAADVCTSQSVRGLWWRNEREVIFARGEGALYQDTALYAWRVGRTEPRLVLRTPHLFASPLRWKCAVAQDRLVCFFEEPARPRRLVAIDLNSGAIDTLYDPNPGFARFDIGPAPQRIEFRSPSGVESHGFLVLPPQRRAGERLSLVIVTYRCPGFLRGGVGDEYPVFPFAAEGHAVLCFSVPDYDHARLATMDWAAYLKWARGAGDREKRSVQEGLDAAVAQLDRMGVIDPNRVGVTGLSFGAETVMYALFSMPTLAAGIASGAEIGPASPFLYGHAMRDFLRQFGLGSPQSGRWDALSITRNAGCVRGALLLNVADHEMISSLHPLTALEDAGRPVEMYVFPHEYHIKWQPQHRLAIYERNIDWMNFWLRGVEDPSPAKSDQYTRWRSMRESHCKLLIGSGAPWYCR